MKKYKKNISQFFYIKALIFTKIGSRIKPTLYYMIIFLDIYP